MVTGNVTIKFDVDDCRVKCTVRGELPQAISTAKFIERLLESSSDMLANDYNEGSA